MTPFTTLTSPALPLLEDRIDTDILYPARFLLLMAREGLGDYFCRDRRIDAGGQPIPGNPFDDPRYAGAQILLSGEDFGSGSSREQAVWALTGFGVRCVVAVSFGEIFAANCLRNGVLAISLPRETIDRIAQAPGGITIDLRTGTIVTAEGPIAFEIPEANRARLLNGWDDIDMIMAQEGAAIGAFEERQERQQPWLYEEAA